MLQASSIREPIRLVHVLGAVAVPFFFRCHRLRPPGRDGLLVEYGFDFHLREVQSLLLGLLKLVGDVLLDQLCLARMLGHSMHQLARDDFFSLAEVVMRELVWLRRIVTPRRRGMRLETSTLLVRQMVVL